MESYNLVTVKTKGLKRRTVLNCQVTDVLSAKSMKIADETETLDLKLEAKNIEKHQRYLIPGKFIKIISPAMDSDGAIVVNDKTAIMEGKPISDVIRRIPYSNLDVMDEVGKEMQTDKKVILKVKLFNF